MKKCFKCLSIKDLKDFYMHKDMNDGHLNKCKTCVIAYTSLKAQADPAKHNAKNRRWRKLNLEKARLIARNWIKKNASYANSILAKRRAQKLNATPKWLTKPQLAEIKEYYVLAKELKWLSDERLEVDHIIPLCGKNVSGLHVPWNLQILPRSKNITKGNKVF